MRNGAARSRGTRRGRHAGHAGRSARHARPGGRNRWRIARKPTTLVAAIGLAGPVILGGPDAFSARYKTVSLSIDGVSHEVTTSGTTVQEVLESQDIEIGPHDAIAPSPGSAVEDGSQIAFRFGRELDLTVDGEERGYWVTALRVGTALTQIGQRYAEADLSASRSARIGREGIDLSVKTDKRITLVNGDEKSTKSTTALTARGALRDLDISYDTNDEITPSPGTPIDDGSRVRVVRIEHDTRKVKVAIPNKTVVRYDDEMAEGRETVQRRGHDGIGVDTYRMVLANGERRDRTKVDRTVRVEPVARVEVHGTRKGLSTSACPSGSEVEEGLTANAVSVHRAVCAEFPAVDSYLGLRPGDGGEHGDGRALDIMISGSALGDAIAGWVRAHHARLGVSEVIWSQRIWTTQRSSEGWRPMEDRGSATANHYDHVHVTVH
ncbi:MAG: ubiquitin-like domain-containing protein [Actinomycetes bacterium]